MPSNWRYTTSGEAEEHLAFTGRERLAKRAAKRAWPETMWVSGDSSSPSERLISGFKSTALIRQEHVRNVLHKPLR